MNISMKFFYVKKLLGKFTLTERFIMSSKSYFLVAAFASFVLSVSLWFLGTPDVAKEQGIFVGLWVPSILTLGSYFNE